MSASQSTENVTENTDHKAFQTMEYSIEDGIAVITLNRADEYNSMTPEFWLEMPMVFAELDTRMDVRVAVIRSTGKHFTAGLDLKTAGAELAGNQNMDPARAREKLRRKILKMQDTFSCIERARFPVIAAIQGGCIGAGVDLITACCMRYACQDSFFSIQEINVGIVADVGTLQRIPHLLPQGLVRELAYTGRRFKADEAKSYGFVNDVFGDYDACLAHSMDMARDIASKSPLATTGIKQVLNQGRGRTVEDGLEYVATWNTGLLIGEDLQKAAMAVMTKQETKFDDLAS